MAVELATAYVNIQASARGIGESISAQIGAPLVGAGALGGKKLTQGITKSFDAKAVGATSGKLLATGIGAGLAGGAALFKVGDTFDAAFDQIRVGTGATGDALKGLQGDFREVFKNIPADAGTVGTAIADLNTRLGLSGKPLQDLSKQFIDLSRITGTDLSQNIQGITRVFGDWDIKNPSLALDQLFRASQASGIGLDDLQQSVVQFGSPLRNLGFSFESSVALLSQFDRAGVNTATVFAGLKAGVGKLAKSGEDIPTTFRRVVDEIQALGPGTEATAKAIELFGQRAGPDLADAIAGGKFEIDELYSAITGGKDTVATAAADTADFAEKWQTLVNKVLVALEPAATKVFAAVGTAVESLTPVIESAANSFAGLINFFSENKGVAQATAIALGGIATALAGLFVAGKVIGLISKVTGTIKTLVSVFKIVRTAVLAFNAALLANPVVLIIAGIVALGAALFLAYKKFDGFRKVVDTVGRAIKGGFLAALDAVRNWWQSVGPQIVKAAQAAWDGIKAGVTAVGAVLRSVFSAVGGFITGSVVPTFKAISKVVSSVFSVVGTVIAAAWNGVIQPIFRAYVAYVTGVFIPVVRLIFNVIKTVFAAVGRIIAATWSGVIRPAFTAIGAFVTSVFLPGFKLIATVVKATFRAVGAVVSAAWNGVIRPVFSAVGKFITGTVLPAFNRLKQGVSAAFGAAGKAISTVYNSVIRPAFNGLRNAASAAARFLGDKVRTIVGVFTGLPRSITRALGGIASAVMRPFKSAFNALARVWNRTVGSFSFTVPDFPGIPGRGRRISFPRMPTFHKGGVVPGRPGEEVIIKALAGETVLTREQSRQIVSSTDIVADVVGVFHRLPVRITQVMRAVDASVADPFKAGFNALTATWNRAVSALAMPDMPTMGQRGGTFGELTLPELPHLGDVADPFKAGFNALADKWNRSVEALSLRLPDVGRRGDGVDTLTLPVLPSLGDVAAPFTAGFDALSATWNRATAALSAALPEVPTKGQRGGSFTPPAFPELPTLGDLPGAEVVVELAAAFERLPATIAAELKGALAVATRPSLKVTSPSAPTTPSRGGLALVPDMDVTADLTGALSSVSSTVARSLEELAGLLARPLGVGFKALTRAWNRTIGALSVQVLHVTGGTDGVQRLRLPTLPVLHNGGTVPGSIGDEVLIKALAGETVLTRRQSQEMLPTSDIAEELRKLNSTKGANPTINIYETSSPRLTAEQAILRLARLQRAG